MATDERIPIRVELVDADAPPSSEPSSGWRGEPPSERRVGLAAAIGAIVIALLVGIVIGRASVSPDGEADDSTSSTLASESAAGTIADTIVDTIDPVTTAGGPAVGIPAGEEAPTTTAMRPEPDPAVVEAAAASADIVTASVEVDPRLAGIDLTVVAPKRNGAWARLDLRDGRLDEITDVDPSTFLTDQPVVAGEGWFAYATGGGSPTAALWRDATTSWEIVPIAVEGRVLREAATGSFWRSVDVEPAAESERSGQVFELWDVTGGTTPARTGESLVVPPGGVVLGADPAGGLIVQTGGRLFGVGPDQRAVLGTGDLIAANRTVVATWTCDETFECGLSLTDRSTGVARFVTIDTGPSPVGPPASTDIARADDLSAALTSDGGHLAVNLTSPSGYELGVIDLATGDVQRVAGHSRPFSMTWTPDGRFLLHTNLGVPYAFDRSTGAAFPVAPAGRLGGWNAVVAVR